MLTQICTSEPQGFSKVVKIDLYLESDYAVPASQWS